MKRIWGIIETMCRFVLAAVFLWAGVSKLVDPGTFADGMSSFRLFPDPLINLMALTIPVLEIVTALLLLTTRWQRSAALLFSLLTMAFIFLFAWTIFQGHEVECSCFGASIGGQGADIGLWRAMGLFILSSIVYAAAIKLPEKPSR